MPNLTISVSDELKAEMDKLSEVNWSEVCRNAISMYIEQRKNPTPKIELDIRRSILQDYDFETGYPAVIMDVRIQNRMNSEITVDRVLASARSVGQDGRWVALGQANDLNRRTISSNSVGVATIIFVFPKEKLGELQDSFKETFDCYVRFTVFVDGFKNAYSQESTTVIPIDVWKRLLEKALGKNQVAQ